MKINFCLILLFFTTLICNAQNNKKTDWENDGLKGKVKSIKIKDYEPIFKFGEIVKGEERCVGYGDGMYEVHYNNAGKITDCKSVFTSGEATCFPIGVKYIYDEKGNNIEQRRYYVDNGSSDGKTLYKYNNDESIAEENYYSEFGYNNFHYHTKTTYTYKYNEKGNVIEENRIETQENPYGETTVTTITFIYKYDNKGNLVESKYGNNIYIYKYDNTGKMIEKIENGLIIKYNNKGDAIEDTYGIYEYKYDKKGNWIERITYERETRTPRVITERTIEYYE